MSWSDERVEILKRMWLNGQSASEIAKELGEITRNAVIGKVHRLGLSNRETNYTKSEETDQKKQATRKRGRPPKDPTSNKQKNLPKQANRGKLNWSRKLPNESIEENNLSDESLKRIKKDNLIVEARLPNSDIGFVKPGQSAVVKLSSTDSVNFGQIEAIVTQISPDTEQDENDKRVVFYKILLETEKNYFESKDKIYQLTPGVKVTASIHIGQRTVANYLL